MLEEFDGFALYFGGQRGQNVKCYFKSYLGLQHIFMLNINKLNKSSENNFNLSSSNENVNPVRQHQRVIVIGPKDTFKSVILKGR